MDKKRIVQILLRVSIASVFLYAAIASLIEPNNWLGYYPQILRDHLPTPVLLFGFAGYEVALGFWVLSGWKTLYAGLLAAVTLLGIITTNLAQIDIVFRDFAIFFSSLALVFNEKNK